MGIRIDHTHDDGRVCYRTSHHYPLTEMGLYRMHQQVFAVAYMPYTSLWYAFDPETGKEIATFSRDFFWRCIAPFKVSSLVPDPDCVPRQPKRRLFK